jgi:hypothetical protein
MSETASAPDLVELTALLRKHGDRQSAAFQFNDHYWEPIAQAMIENGWHRADLPVAEAVTEYAVDYQAGYCQISEEPANAYELAQFMVDATVVRRTVLRSEWIEAEADSE